MQRKVGAGIRLTGNEWDILRVMVMARDNCTCQFEKLGLPPLDTCTNEAPSRRVRNFQVHHIVEVEHGGSNEMDNLTTLCFEHHCYIHPHLRHQIYMPQKSFEMSNREFEMPVRIFDLDGSETIE